MKTVLIVDASWPGVAVGVRLAQLRDSIPLEVEEAAMHAKLMQDGSVPIPEELRTALHMRPGDRVELRVIEGGLSVKRVPLTVEEERHIWDAHLDEINAGALSQIDDDQVDP